MSEQKPGTTEEQPQDNEIVQRSHWSNRLQFFLAALGYSIGMGSLTRFPYVLMKNGGGAFLIPWFVALIIGGIPLFYVELALGQFSGRSPLTMWSLCPALEGIGYASATMSGIMTIYYSMQLTWSLFYVVKSFALEVPWKTCGNSWNTDRCFDPANHTHCIMSLNDTEGIRINENEKSNLTACNLTSLILPSEEFWNNEILGVGDTNIENMGILRWQLVLTLAATWTIVFLCLMKGVKTLGKVVYVSATLPYLLITALVIRGLTLDGAIDGLMFYLKPDFATLLSPHVWIEASLQVFFSLGPGWGAIITMASYNPFHHKFPRDAISISFADALTAFYCGFAVFPVLGFMAKLTQMPITSFATSGIGMSFVVLPQVLAEMPGASIWAVLFFINMFTLGIDSQFGLFDTVVSGIMDKYPHLRRRETLVTASVAAIFFVISLPFATEGGMYLYVLFDWYTHVITTTIVTLLEVVIIAYVYGFNRFSFDVELMLGSKPGLFWKISWLVITPIFLTALVFFGLWNMRAPTYQGYEYPTWAIAVGWLVALASFLPIPAFAIYAFIVSPEKTVKEKLISIMTPTAGWVPAKEELVDSYRLRYDQCNDISLNTQPDGGEGCKFRGKITRETENDMLL